MSEFGFKSLINVFVHKFFKIFSDCHCNEYLCPKGLKITLKYHKNVFESTLCFASGNYFMIIFKSHSTTSNQYNLTSNFCKKHETQLKIEPRIFGSQCQCSTCTPELSDHTDRWTCNSHKLPMVQPVPTLSSRYLKALDFLISGNY